MECGCSNSHKKLQRQRVIGVVIMNRETMTWRRREMQMIRQMCMNQTPVVMRGVSIVGMGVHKTALQGAELQGGHQTRCGDPSHSLIVRDPVVLVKHR